jgi:hypothetical protein
VAAVSKGAASAPLKASRRSSLIGVGSQSAGIMEKRKSLGRRSSNGPLPQAPRKKAPKSYREDEEAAQLAGDVFEFFDIDGSGLLDRHELEIAQHFLQSTSLEGAGVVSGIWADCNPDVDDSGDVDPEEWASFMEAIYQILGRKQFITVISAWHTDARSRAAKSGGDLQQAAALKIQAMVRRRSSVRASLSQQRRKSNQLEHRLTTVGEVWELLTRVEGTYGRTMTVGELVGVIQWARDTGLDTQLALTAPVTDEDGTPGGSSVEDFLPIQVGRLCELVLDGDVDTMTDGEVWFDLAITKSDRMKNGLKDELLHRDLREREIDHKQFSRIVPILARMMSLDRQIILSHISWLKTRVFEAPAPLLALLVQQCANHKSRQGKEEAYRAAPDVSILDVPFSLIDHVKLCINGQTGLLPSEMRYLFYTVSRQLHERLEARMEIRKEANPRYMGKVPTMKKPGDDEQDTFVGAEAFQVLIEELFKMCPAGKFVSPLTMLVYMIRQGTENPRASEETIAANEALARRLTLADGQKIRADVSQRFRSLFPLVPVAGA